MVVADTYTTNPASPEYHSAPETPIKQPRKEGMEAIRTKQLQIAKIRVHMNQLKEELDDAFSVQNLFIAQHAKSQMGQLEKEQDVLENQQSAAKADGLAPPTSATTALVTPVDSASLLDLSEGDQTNYNPVVTLKCLKMLVITLQDHSITQLNNTLHTMLEGFVITSVQSELHPIRKKTITALRM